MLVEIGFFFFFVFSHQLKIENAKSSGKRTIAWRTLNFYWLQFYFFFRFLLLLLFNFVFHCFFSYFLLLPLLLLIGHLVDFVFIDSTLHMCIALFFLLLLFLMIEQKAIQCADMLSSNSLTIARGKCLLRIM